MAVGVSREIDAIIDDVERGLQRLESQFGDNLNALQALLVRVEEQRNAVQGTLEQRSLERSLEDERVQSPRSGQTTGRLRLAEDQLSEDYSRASTLYHELADFSHLLAATRQQFRSREELPGLDDAQRLAVRRAMVQAQEDERRRLAREIHDGPAQVLANAIIGLEFIDRAFRRGGDTVLAEASQEIDRVKRAMREGLTEIRRFIFDLRPTMLSQRGLGGTVEHYIETYRQLFPGDVELSVAPKLPALTPEQELTAFRVIQESLQNVHRHTKATRTWVSIAVSGQSLVVTVRDNGEGFRPEQTRVSSSGGFGIAGMRERAEMVGARLRITSAPGKGTEVRLAIPLSSRAVETAVEPPRDGSA